MVIAEMPSTHDTGSYKPKQGADCHCVLPQMLPINTALRVGANEDLPTTCQSQACSVIADVKCTCLRTSTLVPGRTRCHKRAPAAVAGSAMKPAGLFESSAESTSLWIAIE